LSKFYKTKTLNFKIESFCFANTDFIYLTLTIFFTDQDESKFPFLLWPYSTLPSLRAKRV